MSEFDLEAIRARDAACAVPKAPIEAVQWAQSNADRRALLAAYDALRSRLAEAERDGGKWREAALRVGESLIDNGPEGYYQMTPEAWLSWALVALKQADSATHRENDSHD